MKPKKYSEKIVAFSAKCGMIVEEKNQKEDYGRACHWRRSDWRA
jgi:hypothetical protein